MISPGRFRAKATTTGFTKTKKDKPQFAIEFELLDGDDAGKHITWFGGFEGKGFEYSTKAMRACGWDGETDPEEASFQKEVILVIEHEEYEGKTNARVKYINSLDDAGPNAGALIEKRKMEGREKDDFKRAFMAQWKASGGMPANNTRPVAAKRTGTDDADADVGSDDDIPF